MKKILGCMFILCLTTQPSFAEPLKSTLRDQQSVEVTVYNSNIALIKEVRDLNLPAGEGELRFMDVAAQIMPVTVLIKSLNHAADLTILEQNYEYDLISPQKLMDKYVGKKIKIIDYNPYQDKKETLEAVLLSNNNGEIYKIDNEIYLGHPGYKILPEIPDNLIAQPTLTWLFGNNSVAPHKLEVSYLTNNMTWKADYVVSLNENDTKADVSGWVTLDNTSGATYQDAKLKLIAGDINRVLPEYDRVSAAASDVVMYKEAAPQFVEKSFFEYHIYNLQRRATIKDKQTKQLNLLEAAGVDIQKEFLVRGNQSYLVSSYIGQPEIKTPVEVFVKFKNSEQNHMGMPLPEGVLRLYKKDSDGSQQFIGEDMIKHTPKDEAVKLKIGEAFDVAAERVQTDYQVLGNHRHESEWEIALRNHKKEDVTIVLLEPMTSDWEILKSTHVHKKADAFSARFEVKVPRDEEVKVKYRARVKYY